VPVDKPLHPMDTLREDFTAGPSARWRRIAAGRATLEPTGTSLRFVTTDAHPAPTPTPRSTTTRGCPVAVSCGHRRYA